MKTWIAREAYPDPAEYLDTGKCDERGQPLFVAVECPEEFREECAVPKDGIELRHGKLTPK